VIYQREVVQGKAAPGCSRFLWNDVFFRSFQSGYLKQLDWNLYCRLNSPVAKRLYRFLDKRFYHSSRVEIDLQELALRKVRLTGNYNTAQMKRTLLKGIQELEHLWDLKPRQPEDRFRKDGIGPASAEELSLSQPSNRIREMLELYDWYNSRGQPRGPGFLVQSIKNPSTIALPPGFESSIQRQERQQSREAQKQAEANVRTKRERLALRKQNSRQRAFMAFWDAMSPSEQDTFETEALEHAEVMTKRLYLQHSGKPGKAHEIYRRMLLESHFRKTRGQSS
jgi:hypothetical protein